MPAASRRLLALAVPLSTRWDSTKKIVFIAVPPVPITQWWVYRLVNVARQPSEPPSAPALCLSMNARYRHDVLQENAFTKALTSTTFTHTRSFARSHSGSAHRAHGTAQAPSPKPQAQAPSPKPQARPLRVRSISYIGDLWPVSDYVEEGNSPGFLPLQQPWLPCAAAPCWACSCSWRFPPCAFAQTAPRRPSSTSRESGECRFPTSFDSSSLKQLHATCSPRNKEARRRQGARRTRARPCPLRRALLARPVECVAVGAWWSGLTASGEFFPSVALY